ncbi:MAG: dihydropteroate synthase [Flavobacteriaceae bacterium]|nr:dihydropteroate synthase [Flavobacteriaceae bacterium]
MHITCKGTLIDLSSPKIMGILNITPDSFYDGGKYTSDTTILKQVEKMLTKGATFIDVGAYSSRPKAQHITEDEELLRSSHAIELIISAFPKIFLSVDTFRSKVAKQALLAGACMVNDISGGSLDKNMFEIVAKNNVPYILMHMLGTPQNMQDNPQYDNIIFDIRHYFSEKITQLRSLGVNDIILDVGFGFGKNLEHNYTLLKNLNLFTCFDLPVLAGISRKSMLYNVLKTTAKKSLNATTIANTIALQNGAAILRVHDVKEAQETVQIFNQLNN